MRAFLIREFGNGIAGKTASYSHDDEDSGKGDQTEYEGDQGFHLATPGGRSLLAFSRQQIHLLSTNIARGGVSEFLATQRAMLLSETRRMNYD